MEKITKWEKWIDPFTVKKEKVYIEEDEDVDEYENNIKNKLGEKSFKMMVGPFGAIPIGDHNIPSKNYNLFVLHTNFDIGVEEALAVREVNGVEICKVLTSYRLWVGIGKLFDANEVQGKIDDAIKWPKGKQAAKQSNAVFSKYWIKYETENGLCDIVTGLSKQEVENKLANRKHKAILGKSWEN